MKNKIFSITKYTIFGCMIIFFLCACEKNSDLDKYEIYFSNSDSTGLITQSFTKNASDMSEEIDEVLYYLSVPSEKLKYKNSVGRSFDVISYTVIENQIVLNLSDDYLLLSDMDEVLSRASIVRSLGQIDGISGVSFLINNSPLLDNLGNPIGVMKPEMFIVNAGKEINAYDEADLILYFADKSGQTLNQVTRHIVFNTNIALEKQVIEELIKGPNESDRCVETINPETKVISTTVTDGTCYVSLDSTFLQQYGVSSPEVTVYSIVNSLIELPGINKVQISIDANNSIVFREVIPLSTIFERNLDIVSDH